MTTTDWLFMGGLVIFATGSIFYVFPNLRFWDKSKKKDTTSTVADNTTKQLQLQAYERLTLLADRISLQNVISRTNMEGITVRDMQMLLNQNIKQEFEYNISQQIYVSSDAWTAIKNLKDQNLYVVNQIASFMPANASGTELNRAILEFLMNDKRGTLPELVGEVLSFEAKKVL